MGQECHSMLDRKIHVRCLRSHPAGSPGTDQAQVDATELGADKLSGNADRIQPNGVLRRPRNEVGGGHKTP